MLVAGRKIEAIRLYREARGGSLADAKQAVETIEDGRQWDEEAPIDDDEPELTREVLDLVLGGNLIAAVKKYREATGAGLKESKAAVEALARARGIEPRGVGCAALLPLLVLGMFFTAGLAVAAWYLAPRI